MSESQEAAEAVEQQEAEAAEEPAAEADEALPPRATRHPRRRPSGTPRPRRTRARAGGRGRARRVRAFGRADPRSWPPRRSWPRRPSRRPSGRHRVARPRSSFATAATARCRSGAPRRPVTPARPGAEGRVPAASSTRSATCPSRSRRRSTRSRPPRRDRRPSLVLSPSRGDTREDLSSGEARRSPSKRARLAGGPAGPAGWVGRVRARPRRRPSWSAGLPTASKEPPP